MVVYIYTTRAAGNPTFYIYTTKHKLMLRHYFHTAQRISQAGTKIPTCKYAYKPPATHARKFGF